MNNVFRAGTDARPMTADEPDGAPETVLETR